MAEPLVVMTWDHIRGRRPVEVCAAQWKLDHPGQHVLVQTRSLADFEHDPIQELARRCDLVLYDHPFVGTAAHDDIFLPLDDWIIPEFLEDQRTHSVGPSHASYEWNGHQWGLAIDAAAQVSAYRPDLSESTDYQVPRSWDELEHFAAHLPPQAMGMALNPTHVFATFLTLLAAVSGGEGWDGRSPIDSVLGNEALGRLRWLWEQAHPLSRASSPIDVLEAMGADDGIWYVPLIFGYVNYSVAGYKPHRICFGAIPASHGAILGGVGIGVSALRSENRAAALEFAQYLVTGSIQGGPYVRSGGQPGYRDVWEDELVNVDRANFFKETLPVLDGAYVRPRYAGYQTLQRQAELYLHDELASKSPHPSILAGLNKIFSQSTHNTN